MDFQRLLLVIALSFVLLMLYQAWEKDYGPHPVEVTTTTATAPNELPAAPVPAAAMPPSVGPALQSAKRISVVTDTFHAEIDTEGGDIRRVDLVRYPVAADKPDEPYRLMDDSPEHLFIAQSGLRSGAETSAAQVPDHYAVYTADQTEYQMAPGQDELSVPLHWRSPTGVSVDKVLTFHRGTHVIEVRYDVQNHSSDPWTAYAYYQLQRAKPTEKPSAFGVHTYTGGVIHGGEVKYEKVSFEEMDKSALNKKLAGGWAAMIQHYFLGAWIPPKGQTDDYYSKALGDGRYLLGLIGPGQSVAPGQRGAFEARLYVGPKKQDHLGAVADGLELTIDYGKLTILAEPIFWLLKTIHKLVNNWGWSIILLTLLIKLAFFHLSATSYKSMANMRKLQPRLQALKERFGDDRQALNESMMKMYREEKINPLGGCLPIVVQIPVFIALYWVLLESVELRQAPFIFWIHDLSTKDPFFVLPILNGVSMLIQQRLNPTPMDPIQAKVMMVLPVMFTAFFAFFPAGLVLYWVVNSVLSITQQWYITRWVVKA